MEFSYKYTIRVRNPLAPQFRENVKIEMAALGAVFKELQNVYRTEVNGHFKIYAETFAVAKDFLENAYDSIIDAFRTSKRHGNGVIHVRLTANDEHIRLEIEDNGTGIDPKLIPKLGKCDLSTRKDAKYGHMGYLGIAVHLAWEDIRNFNGECGFKNKGHNKGAIFWYEIPLSKKGMERSGKITPTPLKEVDNLVAQAIHS